MAAQPPEYQDPRSARLETELREISNQLQQGHLGNAEPRLLSLLDQHPQSAAGHRLMARLAASSDRTALALEHMATVCRLLPESGALRCEFGCLLAHSGQLAFAVRELETAVRLSPELPDTWYFLGITLERLGRDGDALAPLRRAHGLAPHNTKILHALARAEFAAGYPEDALPLWQRLHAATPEDTDTLLKLGETLCRLGDNHSALALYQQALTRAPSSADLWMACAQAAEDAGRREDAIAAYQQALALRPGWAFPLSGLLGVQRGNAPDELVASAVQQKADPLLGDAERALIGYELGKVHDQRGDYRSAMEYWNEANAARRRVIGEFNADIMLDNLEQTIATFADNRIAQWSGGSSDDRPLFVVGMPRSGTTLTEQIIAAHPQAFGRGELPDMALISREFARSLEPDDTWPQAIHRLSDERLRQGCQRYLRALTRNAPSNALRLVDKAPMNFFLLGLIARMFPKARAVWCRRDPRDIALSIYGENFALTERFATTLAGIGHCINVQERLMRHWQAVLPLPILELDYQRLVTDPEPEARRLIEFTGLDWDPACLQFHAGERSVQTPSRWQVRQPVHTRSVDRWKNYEFALQPLLDVLGGDALSGLKIEPRL